MASTCLECGQPTRRVSTALRCFPCAKSRPRIAQPDRRRSGQLSPKIDGAYVVCLDCHKPLRLVAVGGRRGVLRCKECMTRRHLERKAVQIVAMLAVARAVRAGLLPRPADSVCADCGKPAAQYDHRDYTRPLQVAPVCRSCNVMRGPAEVWATEPQQVAA